MGKNLHTTSINNISECNKVLFSTYKIIICFFFTFACSQAQVQLDATGSGNDFVVTYPAVIVSAPSGGIEFTFKANHAITGTCSLNLNSTGAKPILKNFDKPLAPNDIKAGHYVRVIYDNSGGGSWQMLSNSATPGGNIIGSGAANGVAFWNNATTMTADGANFVWDNTTKRLGVGTNAPASVMEVVSQATLIDGIALRVPNLGAGNITYISQGKSATSANQAEYRFTYIGSGSLLNAHSFGFNAIQPFVHFTAAQNVGIGVATPAEKFVVVGNTSVTGNSSITGTMVSSNARITSLANGVLSVNGTGNIVLAPAISPSPFTVIGNNIRTLNNTDNIQLASITGAYMVGTNTGLRMNNNNSVFLGNSGSVTTAQGNNFIGNFAGMSHAEGIDNNYIGRQAGMSNVKGSNNNFFGFNAGESNNGNFGGGSQNNFFGFQAGRNNFGSENNIMGSQAGFNNQGDNNNFFGNETGFNNLTGTRNNFFGPYAGRSNTSGNYNNFIGYNAGFSNTTGTDNTFIGFEAGKGNTTGSRNIAIGSIAGIGLGTGNDNITIGTGAAVNSAASNAIAIGRNSATANSNTMTLGGTTAADVLKIGIGISNPDASLYVDNFHVSGGYITKILNRNNGNGSSGLLVNVFNTAASSTIADFTSGSGSGISKLVIRADGNVGIGTTAPGNNLHVNGGARISNLSASGAVFANANGDLFVSTSSGNNAWTVNGANIYPQNPLNNIGIGIANSTIPGIIAGASRYITFGSNPSYVGGSYPSFEFLSMPSAQNTPYSRIDFLGQSTPVTAPTLSARIQFISGRAATANGQLAFYTSNGTLNEAMRINENRGVAIGSGYTPSSPPVDGLIVQGNVGIETTAPLAKLDIGGTISGTTQAILARGNLDPNFQLQVLNGTAPLIAKIGILYGVGGADNASINYYRGGSSTDGYMAFSTLATDRLTILSNGRVGVGTTNPSSTLHVNGSISRSIVTTNTNITLDETHYTIILTNNNLTVTLPPASACTGRVYVILSRPLVGSNNLTISYLDFDGASSTAIPNRNPMTIQSNGTVWNRIQ